MISFLTGKSVMCCTSAAERLPFVLRIVTVVALSFGIIIFSAPVMAQDANDWSPARTIPGYHPETDPPILIADQNGTIHAFSSQLIGDNDEKNLKAIMYNQWSSGSGWTMPVDVLLSSNKNEARLLDAFMDQSGMMHVIFFGGDNTNANIYYSKAPATRAGLASSWSKPILVGPDAHDPERGGIAGDDNGNLMVTYSGHHYGTGWYVVTSTDNGNTWSEATLYFPVYYSGYSPFYLRTHRGESGLLHAVWSVNDIQNHGQAIYYATFDFATMQWGDPLLLEEPIESSSLGTQVPNIIEYHDSLFVMYYNGSSGQQYFIRSDDGGRSWSTPIAPFPQVGLNDVTSFIVDSNDDLHFFWAQRLSGSPDIHAVWHSVWQGTGWSEQATIVTGNKVIDKVGFGAFDPNTVHAAMSEGNNVLVTWRTDRGSRGNGVWYSTTVFDVPQLPLSPLPTVPSALVVDSADVILAGTPEPTVEVVPEFGDQLDIQNMSGGNPAEGLLTSLVPVTLLVLLIGIFHRISHSRQR